MSYNEYLDLFFETQKKDCPFRAFTFDIVGSRNQEQYINNPKNHFELVFYVYKLLEREEKLTGVKILLNDDYNKTYKLTDQIFDNNLLNPMILGDMATYFVYNGSISPKRMLELFSEGLEKYNIDYPFHFSTGVYETNKYAEGGIKLYKGYMPQILENLGKKNNFIISRNTQNKTQQSQENSK